MLQLAHGLARRGHETAVWTLFPGGALAGMLAEMPEVGSGSLFDHSSGSWLRTGLDLLAAGRRLRRLLDEQRFDVVYSFLYPSSAITGFAIGRRPRVPWVLGARSARMELNWKRVPFFKLCARLSTRAELLVANSRAGLEHHLARGFRTRRTRVVFNGVDLDRFRPEPELRRRTRRELGVPEHAIAVGRVGRLSPEKDYPTFLRAAASLLDRHPEMVFLCVGGGPNVYAKQLRDLGRSLGLGERVRWTGEFGDMVALYNAIDVCVSTSSGESFPNVVAEAMACGVPGIVTDVGDSALAVGEWGRVVPPEDPEAIAGAVAELVERRPAAGACRRYIEDRFGLDATVAETEAALLEVVRERYAAPTSTPRQNAGTAMLVPEEESNRPPEEPDR